MKMKRLSRIAAASMLIATFAVSPTLTYAHQDNDGKDKNRAKQEKIERKEERKERKEKAKEIKLERKNARFEKQCLKSFERIIAMGHNDKEWLKELSDKVCFMPFGIGKKFGDGKASTTPPVIDTTAPIISAITTDPRIVRAEVKWETNEKTRSTLYFGTTSPVTVGAGSIQVSSGSSYAKNHDVDITGLTASTTYYAFITARDPSGNMSTSSEFSFKTQSVPPDVTAPIISSVGTLLGTTTISVGWHTNESATSRLYFGTSTPLDPNASTTPFTENLTLKTDHKLDLSALATSTSYRLLIESKDASGNIRRTSEFQATTLAN